jgi:hypothetical protein
LKPAKVGKRELVIGRANRGFLALREDGYKRQNWVWRSTWFSNKSNLHLAANEKMSLLDRTP